jgi:hypothetical protein
LDRVSILWVLRKYIDSIAQREEEATARRHREARPADLEDDDADIVVPPPPAKEAPRFRCRVCGVEGSDSSFCTDCLAATMEPL